MNDKRSIDLFVEEQVNERHGTTHVHAYLRHTQGGYVLFVAPYRDLGGATRGYPLGAGEWKSIEAAPRFNARRLAALAADPSTLNLARLMAGSAS